MSPKARKEVLDFDGTDPEPLLSALGDLSHQEGWMNLTPGVPSDAIVEESSLFSWLSGARPQAAPMATWIPPATGSPKPGVLGVLHARGRLHPDGVAKLKSIPASWSCRQDHARRGLLFEVDQSTPEEMSKAMMGIVEELATLPTTGRFFVEVFRR
ncbi:MAG: hypothetical protein WCG59_02140 [Actinomycetes bacterium]